MSLDDQGGGGGGGGGGATTSAPHNHPEANRRRSVQVASHFRCTCYTALIVVSATYSLVLTGVTCISGVQSSLNSDKGLGTTSLAVQTFTMILQALFLNAVCISKLGIKGAMLVGIVLESVYVAGNTCPSWFTLLPAAAISGFGRPLIRTAEAIYITKLARLYASTIGADVPATKVKFFYVYYVLYCSARVFGSVASSIILGSGWDLFDLSKVGQQLSVEGDSARNGTASTWNFERDTAHCGANYCDRSRTAAAKHSGNGTAVVHHQSMLDLKPDLYKVYWLCGFSFVCMIGAFVLNWLMLRPLNRILSDDDDDDEDDGTAMQTDDPEEEIITNPIAYLMNTVRYWRNPMLLFIMPLSVYNGIDNAFWSADFTKAFVTCYFGIHWVGFVVAWYGFTSPITVFAVSWMSRPTWRPVTFLMAFCAHMSVCITLLNWTPTVSSLPGLFALSATWGVGSGLWPTIVSALYGVLFDDDLKAAFSNYWLCDSLGAMLTYAFSNAICMRVKTYTFMTALVIGICGYVAIEVRLRVRKRRHVQAIDGIDNVVQHFHQVTGERDIKLNEKSSVLGK